MPPLQLVLSLWIAPLRQARIVLIPIKFPMAVVATLPAGLIMMPSVGLVLTVAQPVPVILIKLLLTIPLAIFPVGLGTILSVG